MTNFFSDFSRKKDLKHDFFFFFFLKIVVKEMIIVKVVVVGKGTNLYGNHRRR